MTTANTSQTTRAPQALPHFHGELALVVAVLINSLGVVMMLDSGSGISAISSVPYAFNRVLPVLTRGTWTYIFQGALILWLMIQRKRFMISYLLSFVVGFCFSEMLDVYELFLPVPSGLAVRVVYFVVSYILISIGIALSNRCGLPIVPTDLFPRELSALTGIPYSRIKIGFDASCLIITVLMTLIFLGNLDGLGIGTVLAALTMGKVIGWIGEWMDKHFLFVVGRAGKPVSKN